MAVTLVAYGVPVLLGSVALPSASPLGVQTTWLVSRGAPASSQPSLSPDGRFVAFSSDAALVTVDGNGTGDVYLGTAPPGGTPYAGTPALVSTDANGAQADGRSSDPAVSADGHFVAFVSAATDLVAGDSPTADVFVRDTRLGTTTRVQGGSLPNGASGQPAISADGRYVAFTSAASNLVAGDTNGVRDVFLLDRDTGTLSRVSTGSSGAQLGGASYDPAISADGTAIAFTSENTGLDTASPAAAAGSTYAWHARRTGAGSTLTPIGTPGLAGTGQTSLSGDGTVVAYVSKQASYHGTSGLGTQAKVFVESLGGHWEWVSDGLGSTVVSVPSLSADGSSVAFVAGTTVRLAQTESRYGLAGAGSDGIAAPTVGPANSTEPAVTAGGRTVALSTTTALTGDGDTAKDVAVVGTVAVDQVLHPALDSIDGLRKPSPLPFVDPSRIPASATAASSTQELGGTKIGGTKIGGTKIGGTKIGGTKIGGTKIGGTKIGGTKIGGTKIGGTKIGGTKIGDLPLSDWMLVDAGGWAVLLQGTPFQGVPLDSITLNQVLAWADANPADPKAVVIRALTLAAFSTQSPLGQLTFMSVLLLDRPVADIPLPGDPQATNLANWKSAVAAQGFDPAVVSAGTTLLDLDGLGVDVELTQVGVVSASEVAPAQTAMSSIPVADLFLDNPLGGVGVAELPSAVAQAVVDCAGFNGCQSGTLAEAAAQDKIAAAATLATLAPGLPGRISLDELVRSLIDPLDFPWENLQWDAIGAGRYNIPDSPAPGERTGLTTVASLRAGFDTGPGGAAYVRDGVLDVQLPPGTSFHDARFTASGPLEYVAPYTPEGTAHEDLGDVVRFHLGDVPSGTTVTVTVRATDAVNYLQGNPLTSVLRSATGQDDAQIVLQDFAGYAQLVDPPAGDTPANAPRADTENRIYFGGITSATDVDHVKIPRPGHGQRLVVANGTDGGNLDLGIFQLTDDTAPTVNGAGAESSDAGASPLLEELPSGVGSDHQQPAPLNLFNVPGFSLLDASTHTGTQEEVVTVDGDGRGGDLLVKIQGADGRTSTRPYTLRYRYLPIPLEQKCPPYRAKHSAGLLSGGIVPQLVLPGTNTIFLVDQTRMTQEYGQLLTVGDLIPLLLDAGDWVLNALGDLDGQFGVKSLVIPITGLDVLGQHPTDAVRATRAQLDANPCSASASNAMSRAVYDLLGTYLDTPQKWADLKNIVIVGGDDQIPFWRVPGATFGAMETGNEGALRLPAERDWSCSAATPGAPPTSDCDKRATPLSAAAAGDFVLTDDAYGDTSPSRVLDRNLYVPDVAVARLVESPQDVRAAVRTFLDEGGKYDADTSLTAGYGAWDELPAGINEALGNRVATKDSLTGTWDRAQLRSKLFPPGEWPDIVSVNAHMTEDALLPGVPGAAGGSYQEGDLYTTADLAAENDGNPRAKEAGSLLFTIGCHAGQAMPDSWYGDANQDWAEVLGSVGGYVASTGYGVADDAATALTERLLVEYAAGLARPGVTAGQAFFGAKQSYRSKLGLYLGYDEKILMQTTYFGLPMYTADGADSPAPPAPSTPSWSAGSNDGLTTQSATFNPQFQTVSTPDGSYQTANGEPPQTSPGNPVLARITADLPTVGGQTPHGALVTSLSTTRLAPERLAVAAETSGGASLDDSLDDIGLPSSFAHVNGQRLALLVSRADAQSTAQATTGTAERLTGVGTRVYYSSSPDRQAPFVDTTAVRLANGSRTVTAVATDDAGPTKAAFVAYNLAGSSSWTVAAMTRVGASDTWTATVPGSAETRWFTQVVDAGGNVRIDTERGYLGQGSQAAPSFSGGGDAQIVQDTELIRELAISDGDSDRFTARVDWGNGWQELQVVRNPDGTFQAVLRLVGQRPGTFPVRIEVCDDSGLCTIQTFTLTVLAQNTAPQSSVTLNTTSPVTDQVLVATGVGSDVDGDPVTLSYQWWVNEQPVAGATGTTFDLGVAGHGDEGDTVTVTVTPNDGTVDGGGSSASAIVRFNTAPTVSAGPDVTVAEGATYSSSGTYADPDGDAVTSGTVDYGDGSGVQPLTLANGTFALSHVYAENGGNTVTVTVTDEHGGTATDTAAVTVTNVAPTIAPNTTPAPPAALGDPTAITVSFGDPGALDTHTVTVSWGDGTTSQATVDQAANTATASHTYAAAGTFTIGVTVTDDDGGSTTESPYDFGVVFDSTAGYVTANGYFTSPAGAWPANPTARGQAEFGMNAKFTTGSPVPTGKMRFTYDITPLDHGCAAATCLQLDSTAYTSLVISGSKATLKGTATLNGATGYTFVISVIDNAPDKVRVKIVRLNKVVYDSQPGAADTADPTIALDGGSVLLKKAG